MGFMSRQNRLQFPLDTRPTAPSPDNTFDANAGTRAFPRALTSAWDGLCLANRVGTRFTYSSGTYGKQRTFMSARTAYIYKRFRPYGDFMIAPVTLRTERARRQQHRLRAWWRRRTTIETVG